MRGMKLSVLSLLLIALLCSWSAGQQANSATSQAVVPRLVNFSAKATDGEGKVISGIAGATFAIYKEQTGGSSLWLETQNIQADAKGNYTVQLGATKPEGLPLDLFTSGEARWLGVTINGGQEQPRVLLLSVPYALKAADAETVGGLPASAFVLAAPSIPSVSSSSTDSPTNASTPPPTTSNVTTSGGTINALPLWTTGTNIQSSAVTQTGTGATAKVGVNTTAPAATLDVNGSGTVRGNFSLPATGAATATAGKNSQPTTFTSSVFNSTTGTAVAQNFRWQAEPVGNNSSTASGSLNLLYGSGTNTIGETGLKIAPNGRLTFATGQTFPGTGSVSSVGLSAPTADFSVSGSPVTKTGTLALSWKVAPTNTATPNSIVKRDSGGSIEVQNLNVNNIFGAFVEAVNQSSNSVGVFGENDATGSAGVVGQSTNGVGVKGISAISYGLYGVNNGSTNGVGVYGTSIANGGFGVWGAGLAPTGQYDTGVVGTGVTGVYGQGTSGSGFGVTGSTGVWGDTGQIDGVAVFGTAADGFAGIFTNNSPSAIPTLEASSQNLNSPPFWAVGPDGSCTIDASGNLGCSGTITGIARLGSRKVALSAIESPVNWFEDAGSGQLTNGAVVVHLDPDFVQTVNTEKDYKVFPVPNGDCKGLYVTNKTATSFEVRELGGGASNIHFDYRIMAVRRNYENVRFADHTNDPDPGKVLERMRKEKTSSLAPATVQRARSIAAIAPASN